MEVVAAHQHPGSGAGVVPPYQRRDVEEWSHLDHLTGMLEHARVETDHWAANTHNSQHKYGKVVDSRDRRAPDGSQQQRQRRQLEVFQAQVPGGSLQVIRTQTVATSSSRWSSSSTAAATGTRSAAAIEPLQDFENLQLALNPLDLSSQKTKASVGRSGSIGGRRPPSRPRSTASVSEDVASRLQRVSRLCHQLHEDSVHTKPSILDRQNGDGSEYNRTNGDSSPVNVLEDWKRRSVGGKKHSPDLDSSRRLNTVLRGNNVDLEALDQILKSISSSTSSNYSDKISDDLNRDEQPERDTSEGKSVNKRHSFVTVESLKEVKGRLRRLSSPVDDFYKPIDQPKEEEPDDGIVAEDHSMMKKEELSTMPASNAGVSRVRSYVYGMEAMLHNNKKPIIGTGSLESRTSNKSNGSSVNRSEDWYNRRKSYGFEQVHNQQIDQSNSISLRGKNKIESSTDSGICRSTEIVVVPSVLKSQNYEDSNKYSSHKVTTSYGKIGNSTVINLGGDSNKNNGALNSSVSSDYPKQDNELFSLWNRRAMLNNSEDNQHQLDNNKLIKKDAEQITITIPIVSEDGVSNSSARRMFHRQMSDGTSVSVESSWSNHKQNNDSHDIKRHSIAVDESKYVHRNGDNKYPYAQLRRTSLAIPDRNEDNSMTLLNDGFDDEGNSNFSKKQKRVEFCKTEVHFAAESGRVNIVETDEKPPPTQNFRRRRRNSSVTSNHVPEEFNKNGLPLIHFGDTSYEKKLFGVSDQENGVLQPQINLAETFNRDMKTYNNGVAQENVVTVSSVSITKDYEPDPRDSQDIDNLPRGILKNKMIKPKPYLLGDDNNEILSRDSNNEEQEGTIWGVRLRPVQKQEESPQIWRSTVTVQNTSYNIPTPRDSVPEPDHQNDIDFDEKPHEGEKVKPEFQRLLHSLRPARKSEPSIIPPEGVVEQRSSPILDPRRSSWSVADRVKQVEDMRYTENKGYSTRVTFGIGEATVVENGDLGKDKHTTWPRQEETHCKDEKKQSSVLNKGLVVRIGREDSSHTVCSKTTTNQNSNSTTTTTKITIDMSPSPTSVDKFPVFNSIRLPRASLHSHSLKSTSLIMNTFARPEIVTSPRSDPTPAVPVPDQLAALRKLYDEAAEHSDDSEKADEEVRSYMSGGGGDSDTRDSEDDVSSVVSGSWSKMRAFRNIKQHLNNIQSDSTRHSESEMFRNIINRHTYTKKEFSSAAPTFQSNIQRKSSDALINSRFEKQSSAEAKLTSVSLRRNNKERKSSETSVTESPQLERKQINNAKKSFESVKTQYTNGSLSSPSLVGSSIQKSPRTYQSRRTESVIQQSKTEDKKFLAEKEERTSAFNRISTTHTKESPHLARKNIIKKTPLSYSNSQSTYTKKGDSASKKNYSSNYYNEIQSPKPTKKLTEKQKQWKENKPDLLQHYSDTREYVNLSTVIREDNKSTVTSTKNKLNTTDIKKVPASKKTVRPDSPSVERAESPIYENIDDVITGLNAMEKESAILQELTRAADQILQAVNGYTDEDSTKLSTDEDDEGRKHRINFKKTGEALSTISETKSWKQIQSTKQSEVSKSVKNPKSRVRPTSSTSSIESISRESVKPVPPVRQNRASKLSEERAKKKITGSNSELSKATKARRLQRASSREALLQSHGSSSEDISNSIEIIRKPRLVRRTKNQLSSTTTTEEINTSSKKSSISQTNITRRRESDVRRSADRMPVIGLQEIRHKTAISTIKSTAEKAASREKAIKAKSEELRKRTFKKDTSSRGSNMLTSSHYGGGRGSAAAGAASSREPGSTLSAVRTSSGVAMKRISRTEGITRQ